MDGEKTQMTSTDFPPEVLSLFDKYVHGGLDRRAFLKEAGRFLVGAMSAAGALEALTPRFAEAQQVAPGDPGLAISSLEIDSPKGYGKARAYLARPAKPKGKRPVVLVIHENRGLNPHIEDVARRFALAGYIAVAPDALFSLGGYPGDEDKARALEGGNGKLGAVGFCYGGGMAAYLATQLPDLDASVSFYGSAPALEDVPRIKAPLLIQFASTDERINAQWPDYEKALKAAKVRYEAHTYPDTQHGFHNDTTPRYDEAAAKLAWKRTLDFFAKPLKA